MAGVKAKRKHPHGAYGFKHGEDLYPPHTIFIPDRSG